MKARIKRMGDITIVDLMGRIDIESIDAFTEQCLERLKSEQIVFNLQGLNFVGSNGITPFVQNMKEFAQQRQTQPKFCKVSSEFQKIFEASPLSSIEIFETESMALEAYLNPTVAAQPVIDELSTQTSSQPQTVIEEQPATVGLAVIEDDTTQKS